MGTGSGSGTESSASLACLARLPGGTTVMSADAPTVLKMKISAATLDEVRIPMVLWEGKAFKRRGPSPTTKICARKAPGLRSANLKSVRTLRRFLAARQFTTKTRRHEGSRRKPFVPWCLRGDLCLRWHPAVHRGLHHGGPLGCGSPALGLSESGCARFARPYPRHHARGKCVTFLVDSLALSLPSGHPHREHRGVALLVLVRLAVPAAFEKGGARGSARGQHGFRQRAAARGRGDALVAAHRLQRGELAR